MGEYAEMLLDGTLCESCGCFINAEPAGYPATCEECFSEEMKGSVENEKC